MSSGIEAQVLQPYKYGFVTDIEAEVVPPGLSEDVIRLISAKKGEPEWMIEWRLKAYRNWLKMAEPHWSNVTYGPIDYQGISYYAAPKQRPKLESLEQVDPKLLETFEKLGIPIEERKRLAGVAVDAVFDSVSVATTFRETLAQQGIIFCAISEAIREHPDLVRKYVGSVVPYNDNFFAALNSAVFTDGSFAYIPKGVRCPLELSTYFRINTSATGQFERTLIVAEEGSSVSYLEGCSAPIRDEHQLHAAVVELVALDNATIKYSTIQNWYPGDEAGRGGIYNFVTKRGKCLGKNSKISWTQVETGSAITWKYPGCILQGDNSTGEFYSVAVTNNRQQADTGTKMIHLGKNTRSTIVSKGISAGHGQNTYRGLVKILKGAEGARNYSQCDSMLIGDQCGAHTFPYIDVRNSTAIMEHEASTSKIGEDQIFYCKQRGLAAEDAVSMIVNGFCKEVFKELPMEFAVEAGGARPRGALARVPVPGGDPRHHQRLLPPLRAQCHPQVPRPGGARACGVHGRARGEAQADRLGRQLPEPARQRRLLGRREEAQRDPPAGGARAEARHPRRDRFGARHRCAEDRGAHGGQAPSPGQRDGPRHALLPHPYAHHAGLRARPVGRPDRGIGRQGPGAGARGERLC